MSIFRTAQQQLILNDDLWDASGYISCRQTYDFGSFDEVNTILDGSASIQTFLLDIKRTDANNKGIAFFHFEHGIDSEILRDEDGRLVIMAANFWMRYVGKKDFSDILEDYNIADCNIWINYMAFCA